jgi:hypothetical protein
MNGDGRGTRKGGSATARSLTRMSSAQLPYPPLNPRKDSSVEGDGFELLVPRRRASDFPRGDGCPTTIFRIPATDTDIISAQHFWIGGLETAGPGCYDAVAIARAAGFPNGRIRHAALSLNRSEPATKSGQNIPKNRCRTTIAERMVETLTELPFIGSGQPKTAEQPLYLRSNDSCTLHLDVNQIRVAV